MPYDSRLRTRMLRTVDAWHLFTGELQPVTINGLRIRTGLSVCKLESEEFLLMFEDTLQHYEREFYYLCVFSIFLFFSVLFLYFLVGFRSRATILG